MGISSESNWGLVPESDRLFLGILSADFCFGHVCIGGNPRNGAVAAGMQRDEGGDLLNGVDLRRNGKAVQGCSIANPIIWKRTFRGYSPREMFATVP